MGSGEVSDLSSFTVGGFGSVIFWATELREVEAMMANDAIKRVMDCQVK